jgi:hypothetical protein
LQTETLDRRSARGSNDGRRIDVPLEILRRKLTDYRRVSVKLNLTGSLQAGEVSAVANIAGTRIVAGVFMPGKNRDSSHDQQGADRKQRYVLPDYRH